MSDEEVAKAFVADLCDQAAMDRLEQFVAMLAEENTRQNLVAKASLEQVWLRHIADSAQLLNHVSRETACPWLDLGTGAGFPGLVIAIMRPEWDVRLVESRRKRIEWLERVCSRLGLKNCSVLGPRLENVESFSAGTISARAFAPMVKLLNLSARFSTPDTVWLLPKGRSAAQDLAFLPDSLARLFHVEQSVTDPEAGIVIGRLDRKQRQKL